jgi:CHAT domain-containing protein
MYAAFLIRPEWSEPKFVNLCREDQLSSLMTSANDQGLINDLYRKQDSSATANTSLYNIIWHPMDSLLSGVKRVYVSPSGLLHRISLSAIPAPEGGNLNDRYDIHVMGNVRALAEKQTKTNKPPSSSILYGGIDYDNEPMVTITTPPSYDVVTDSTLRSLRGGKWLNLKGTADEVSRIQTITSTNGIKTQVFAKGNASEEAFKLIGNGTSPVPSILHIATHGFAFSTPENRPKNDDRMMMMSMQEDRRSVFRQTTDPLTRAGLVMAGGNKVWSTGQTYPNKEDGILTAREISNMDLRGCVLATLSACETGLGEIKGSEGVFGLQRAFKMAGVENMIVSLWQVPDKATMEFMETFYKKWLTNKLEIRDAFRQTQQEMSRKYKPYQWAAFVLVE